MERQVASVIRRMPPQGLRTPWPRRSGKASRNGRSTRDPSYNGAMTCFMTRLAIPSAFVLLAPLFAALFAASCAEPPPISTPDREVCVKTLTGDVDVPTEQAADILIVVDNSGSMAEEQGNLAQNFLNQD